MRASGEQLGIEPSAAIDYAPPQRLWQRRRVRRRLTLLVCLLIGGLIAWRFAPVAWNRALLLDAQRRCLNAAAPPDRVVFDTDSTRSAALLATDVRYTRLDTGGPVFWFSKEWEQFSGRLAPPGARPSPTLFLGERRTPAGERRLVTVTAFNSYGQFQTGIYGRYIYGSVIVPGSALRRPYQPSGALLQLPWLRFDIVSGEAIRFYAGQPDPADPTHFTIAYEAGTERGVIDGWLKDDDKVMLERRPTPPPPPSAASPPSPG